MARLRDRPDDLFALIARTSESLSIPAHFVEKDFWVTELLRAVVDAAHQNGSIAVFKGGTSLSKAYKLIERFSEDVDVLLVPPDGLGQAARHGILKRICASAAAHLGGEGSTFEVKESETGVKRNVRFPYKRQYEIGPLSEGILLEMGIRGGSHPRKPMSLRSLLSEEASRMGVEDGEFEELASVTVDVLGSERTLVEKLSLLHGLATRFPDEAATATLSRSGRHFYDIHQLLGHAPTHEACEGSGTVKDLSGDIGVQSVAHGWPYTPRPEGGFAESPVFDLRWPGNEVARRGYQVASELIYGARPTFDECVSRVAEYRAIL